MNKYKLVNENRANEFMTELKELLQGNMLELNKIETNIKDVFFGKVPTDFENTIIEWEKEHINQKWTILKERNFYNFVGKTKRNTFGSLFESSDGSTQHIYEEFAKLCSKFESLMLRINSLSEQIIHIEQYKSEEPNSYLNDFLLDDTMTFNEAIFCLLGLNPKSLYKLNIQSLNTIEDLNRVDDEAMLLIVGLLTTVEFRRLTKAPSQINNKPFVFYNKIYSSRLTEWSIEKKFIAEDNTLNQEQKDGGNIEKYNQGYKKLAWFHNARIAINAYESLDPKPKTINALFKDAKFYNSIKAELVLIADEGEQLNKIPSIDTVKNYIYHYNKFKKNYL